MAFHKGTGARGLRAILEHIMLDVMYELPMKNDVKEFCITKAFVAGQKEALTACGLNGNSLKIA
jgi:ATP-dependent Clp protease ATP-binding subunit ClpX